MKKKVIILLITVYCLLSTVSSVYADYVLPYPSYMPGNKLYRLTRIVDQLKKYWYRGNIAQTKYHLALSDKYLVEASTLMEYKQYLLGADALRRSDAEFATLPAYVAGAKKEGVDVHELQLLLAAAAGKHREVLTGLLPVVPPDFTWTPEKSKPTALPLSDIISASVGIRQRIASATGSL